MMVAVFVITRSSCTQLSSGSTTRTLLNNQAMLRNNREAVKFDDIHKFLATNLKMIINSGQELLWRYFFFYYKNIFSLLFEYESGYKTQSSVFVILCSYMSKEPQYTFCAVAHGYLLWQTACASYLASKQICITK